METTAHDINIFSQILVRIIQEQELIIGPLAIEEAKKVPGFHFTDPSNKVVSFDGDAKEVLNKLVSQYEKLFGKISHEVCKEAVQDILAEMPQEEIPSSLK